MEEKDRDMICMNLTFLSENTTWNPELERCLVQNHVFSSRMLEDIKKSPDAVTTLYHKACKRGPKAFEGLVKSLAQSNNSIPAQRLKPDILGRTISQSSGGKVWNSPVYATQAGYTPVYPERKGSGSSGGRNNGHNILPSRPDVNLIKGHVGILGVSGSTNDSGIPPPCIFNKDPLAPDIVLRPSNGDNPDAGITPNPHLHPAPPQFDVKKATQFAPVSKYQACYPMTLCPRGMCLIVNIENFEHHKERRGSSADAANLSHLFNELGFAVTLKTDPSAIDLKRQILEFSQLKAHAKAQMSVIVVLSHGGNGFILGSDGKRCDNEWILQQFNNEMCPDLMGKPKFFIFQACRGDDEDRGAFASFTPYKSGPLSTVETDASAFQVRRQPTWTDMLIAYATIPGYVANRDIFRGSWFVEAICKVFASQSAEKDIREMMDEVSQEMMNFRSEGPDISMQSSTYEVRGFYKKLFFNPGMYINNGVDGPSATKSSNLSVKQQMNQPAHPDTSSAHRLESKLKSMGLSEAVEDKQLSV